jgi:hypothetical protein
MNYKKILVLLLLTNSTLAYANSGKECMAATEQQSAQLSEMLSLDKAVSKYKKDYIEQHNIQNTEDQISEENVYEAEPKFCISKIMNTENEPAVKVYVTWGYNRVHFTNSDATFQTRSGTFTVKDAVGKDRPSPLSFKNYLGKNFAVPQYNLAVGIIFKNGMGIEVAADHYKWVFDNTKKYEIVGDYKHDVILRRGPGEDISALEKVPFAEAKRRGDATWLNFEHTNGYNYINATGLYVVPILKNPRSIITADAIVGIGAGLMIPKTEVNMRQDDYWNRHGIDNRFKVAGFGGHATAKLKLTFWNFFFLQGDAQGGLIKVNNALIDGSNAKLSQSPIGHIAWSGKLGFQIHLNKGR